MNLNLLNTNGFRLIILTFIVFYFPSYVFYYFYKEAFVEAFYGFENGVFYSLIYLCLVVFIVVVLNFFLPKFNLFKNAIYFCPFKYSLINNLFSILFLVFSIKFMTQYGLSFVHSGTSMAEVESYVMILYGLKGYFIFYLFFIYIKILNNQTVKFGFIYWIIIISNFFGLSGSMDIVYIFLYILPLVINTNKLKMIFTKRIYFIKIKNLLLLLLLLLVGLLTIFIGYANKLGVENTYKLIQNFEDLEYLYVATLIRFANGFASFISLSNNHFFDLQLQFQAIGIPIEVFKYRLSVLFNIFSSKPEVFNIARLNYLTVYKDYHATAGATPGLLGSIFYIPFFPINFFVISLYILFIIRQVNRFLNCNLIRLNIIGLLLLFVFLLPLFESPIDYFIIIDPSVLSLFYFITITSYFNIKLKSYENYKFNKADS